MAKDATDSPKEWNDGRKCKSGHDLDLKFSHPNPQHKEKEDQYSGRTKATLKEGQGTDSERGSDEAGSLGKRSLSDLSEVPVQASADLISEYNLMVKILAFRAEATSCL